MKTFNDSKSQHLEELEALISSSLSEKELEDRLSDYHDNDIAEILEKLTPQERLRLYRILGVDRTAEIFAYLDDAGPYMEELSLEKAANVVSHMDSDDAVDVLEDMDESRKAEIDASYAHGSIGRAKQVATSQEFADMTQNALRILKNADGMEVYELTEAIKELSNDKQNISDYLDLFQFWFRDVLMFKATREVDNLVFKQEINYIREQASQRSYENLEKILDALEKTKVRLRANVNTELALELLFLTIREK